MKFINREGFNYLENLGLVVCLVILRSSIADMHFDADGLFVDIGILVRFYKS